MIGSGILARILWRNVFCFGPPRWWAFSPMRASVEDWWVFLTIRRDPAGFGTDV